MADNNNSNGFADLDKKANDYKSQGQKGGLTEKLTPGDQYKGGANNGGNFENNAQRGGQAGQKGGKK